MTDPITETLELSVRHCRHSQGNYSLTINTGNCHVSLNSHAYNHRPGNNRNRSSLGMKPEDVLKLGNLITAEAFRIKGLHEAEK